MDRTRMPWEPDSAGASGVPEGSSGRYIVGDTVFSGTCRGTVVAADAEKATMGVVWIDGDSPITYPIDAPYLREAMPWEI